VQIKRDVRLLIEVTGIEGQITKASKKIAQVLDTLWTEAKEHDRVVVAVNAYRDKPPAERERLEVATSDAMALLTKLDAVVNTTTDLFRVWRAGLTDTKRPRPLSRKSCSSRTDEARDQGMRFTCRMRADAEKRPAERAFFETEFGASAYFDFARPARRADATDDFCCSEIRSRST